MRALSGESSVEAPERGWFTEFGDPHVRGEALGTPIADGVDVATRPAGRPATPATVMPRAAWAATEGSRRPEDADWRMRTSQKS
jgi:hypothetical protein